MENCWIFFLSGSAKRRIRPTLPLRRSPHSHSVPERPEHSPRHRGDSPPRGRVCGLVEGRADAQLVPLEARVQIDEAAEDLLRLCLERSALLNTNQPL